MTWTFLLHRATGFLAVNRARRRWPEASGRPAERVWFDVQADKVSFDHGRHFHSLAAQLIELGHAVAIVDRPGTAYDLARESHGAALLACPAVQLVKPSVLPPEGSYVFTDAMLSDHPQIIIRLEIGATRVTGAMVCPYPVDPGLRPQMTPMQLARGRKQRQRSRLLYFENPKQPRVHTAGSLRDSQCSASDLLGHLQSTWGRSCHSLEETVQPADSMRKPITFGDARRSPVAASQWLETLSRFDFYVGCPGDSHSMNHRVIEAMSVGTVPILEHAHCFTPGLVDGHNAIVFSGLGGFERAISRVLDMDEKSVRQLRRNVIEYYDAHLQTEPFIRRLLMTARMRGGAVLSIPYHLGDPRRPSLDAGDRAIAA